MKKAMLLAACAAVSLGAAAQAIEQTSAADNWSLGIDAGATAPATGDFNKFTKNIRGIVGLHLDKQLTPVVALGVEGQAMFHTSYWPRRVHSTTDVTYSYIGVYGDFDLFNLFQGYQCETRPFTIDLVLGAGWGHDYVNKANRPSIREVNINHVTTKFGLELNFNPNDRWTIGISPYYLWNITNGARKTKFNSLYNAFNLQASLTYHFGGRKFECVTPYNQHEVDALNNEVNGLRQRLDLANSQISALESENRQLAEDLVTCQSRPERVVTEVRKEVQVNNQLNSVRMVFFRIGSSAVTADQQPNVEMIADFLKHHPGSTVVIKGYASKDGNLESNLRLAQKRADSVREMLINRYKISPQRITAEGEGIGQMFEEESWNRVSICTIEDNTK